MAARRGGHGLDARNGPGCVIKRAPGGRIVTMTARLLDPSYEPPLEFGEAVAFADVVTLLEKTRAALEWVVHALPAVTPRLNLRPLDRVLRDIHRQLAEEVATISRAQVIMDDDLPLEMWLPDHDETWYAHTVPSPAQLVMLAHAVAGRTRNADDLSLPATITYRDAVARNRHGAPLAEDLLRRARAEARRDLGKEEAAERAERVLEAERARLYQVAIRNQLAGVDVGAERFWEAVGAASCRQCGAEPGQGCRSRGGNVYEIQASHAARRQSAADRLLGME